MDFLLSDKERGDCNMQCSTVESRVRFVCMHPSTVPRLLLYMSTLTNRIHF